MDKTSSTSSSAAAVADSASAAASSKTTAAGVTATAAVSATSVKLLIKASNQQFDDQIVESDLLWTVKRLKTQLSLVYPSKPPVAEQKLIYSGQLLQDTLQLKDVIRSYKDVYTYNHIFHLVYTQKNLLQPAKPKAAQNMNASTDGLRQRHAAGGQQQQPQTQQPQTVQQQGSPASLNQQQQQSQQQQFANVFATAPQQWQPQQWLNAHLTASDSSNGTGSNASTMPFSLPGQFSMQAMASQQAAMYQWMQHVYSQYIDQCVRFSNAIPGGTPHTANDTSNNTNNTAAGGNQQSSGFPPNPFLQQLPFLTPNTALPPHTPVIPPTFHVPTAVPAAPLGLDAAQQQQQPQQPHATQQQQPNAQPQAAQQPAAQPAQAAAPRFPNMVRDEQDNHDWLDSFFSITRLALFLTILYFNASPLRCLVVVIIAGGIYLYHIGVFRLHHERNNNNINRNNNAAAAAAADQIRQGVQQVQAAQQQQEQQQQNNANPPNGTNNAAATEAAAEGPAAENATEPVLPNNSTEQPATSSSTDAATAADGGQDNNTNSTISFLRTFVVTFFTSLLPEAPAL